MLSKVKRLFEKKKIPDTLTPEAEKTILENGSEAQRAALAARKDARPEVLYYLTDDSSADVRRQVAANPSTPVQADAKLSGDSEESVRTELARKIARLVPNINETEARQLREKTIIVLEKLAQDQLPKIRAMVANEIKSSADVPKALVERLARDLEDIVATPILEYSPLLGDEDLCELIAAGISSARLSAIAKRSEVSERVAADLSATLDVPAITALLLNENAQIREDTLDQIIAQAQSVEDLHKPLVLRPQLSIRAVKRIAGFVASALVHELVSRDVLSEADVDSILDGVRERLDAERVSDDEEAAFARQAKDFMRRGMLDDAFVVQLIADNRRELLLQCLAIMANLPPKIVREVVNSKSGRAVTALAWKAGLAMRTAYEMQVKFALVPKAQLLPARDGLHYPMDEGELDWHLSYFTEAS